MNLPHTSVIMWIQRNPGKTEKDAPRLAYKNYRAFRAETGLELVGYPAHYVEENGDLVHPTDFKTKDDFKTVHYMLTHGEIYWRQLEDEEWQVAKDECAKAVAFRAQEKRIRKRASGSASKKSRKAKKARKITSAETVNSDDDDDEGDEDEEEEENAGEDSL